MLQCLLLPAQRSQPPNPENTCTLYILPSQMVENEGCLTSHLICVKRILHEHKDVDITGVGFCRDEGAERDKSCHLPGTDGQLIDAFQSLSNETSLYGACSEMCQHLSERCLMIPYRQIAIMVKFRPVLHWA